MIYNSQKKIIALVLASMISIAGSFATENYKNSLMGIEFESSTNGAINMVVAMKNNYSGNVTPTKRDANTYVLMLPEIDSKAQTPNFSNTSGISSVNIRTMPYSASSKGYTKITIKTNTYITLSAQSKIYIPTEQTETKALPNKENSEVKTNELNTQNTEENITPGNNSTSENNSDTLHSTDNITNENNNSATVSNTSASDNFSQQQTIPTKQNNKTSENSYELTLLILSFFLVIIMSVWFMLRGKNKLQEIAGEKIDIDVNEDLKNTTTKTSISEIKKNINTIDSKIPKHTNLQDFRKKSVQMTNNKVVIENTDIIDLDELFQQDIKNVEQNKTDTELYDYLESISMNTEETKPKSEINNQAKVTENKATEQTSLANTDIYSKTLNNSNLNFSDNDIKKINQLLALEISDETIENLQNEKITNPIREIISPQKKVENLITDYTIKQDIVFTQKDVEILYKLISVEIDSDFITDLRTHVNTTQTTHENGTQRKNVSTKTKIATNTQINTTKTSSITNINKEQNNMHDNKNTPKISGLSDLQKTLKHSELQKAEKVTPKTEIPTNATFSEQKLDNMGTFKVSGLPDLQEALKHPELYDNVPIDEATDKTDNNTSNIPVSTADEAEDTTYNNSDVLTVSGLPDLQEALKHSELYRAEKIIHTIEMPSNTFSEQNLDNMGTLKVSGLPNLQDVLKHPELYDNVPVDEVTDKNNNTSNTPILTADYTEDTTYSSLNVLKVSGLPDLQEALKHPDENMMPEYETNEKNYNDNSDISANDEYSTSSDNSITENGITTLKVSGLPDLQDVLKHPELYEDKKPVHEVDENKLMNNLLNVKMKPFSEGQKFEVLNEIPKTNITIENNSAITLQPAPITEKQTVAEKISTNTKQELNNTAKQCIIDGSSYDILQTIPFNKVLGCHLAKNEQGYYVLSYIKDKINLIKYYETVTTAKMQARLNEKLPDGTSRVLIKVGTNKLIIDVTANNIKFVMDLC